MIDVRCSTALTLTATPAVRDIADVMICAVRRLAKCAHLGQHALVERPALKQFAELTPADFEAVPAWVACHVGDYDEPWYDDTDEETYRPYTGSLPADEPLLLVAATATLKDGSTFPAFLTPAKTPDDLGTLQPHMFVGGELHGFWGGMVGISGERRDAFLEACDKGDHDVFPIRVAADPGLSVGVTDAVVPGWL